MPALLDYMRQAERCYSDGPLVLGGFKCQEWSHQENGFEGGIYIADNRQDTIVAFAGTDPEDGDLRADAQLALRFKPEQVRSARAMLNAAQQVRQGRLSLTGHSLGGALAQVLGLEKDLPFVTFNAPGMLETTEPSPVARVVQLIQVIKGSGNEPVTVPKANGVNYRFAHDLVSRWGTHIGKVVVLDAQGGGPFNPYKAHQCTSLIRFLETNRNLAERNPFADM
jgi:hypothetical protein